MTARGWSVSLLGVRLAVCGESADVADVLDRYLLTWLPREPFHPDGADHLVEVRRRADGRLDVRVDGETIETAADAGAAVACAQRALDGLMVSGQRRAAIVHGGVVAAGGGAIVLPGSTRAGKSTLVAELIRRGAAYLSDEYALVDFEGLVHPYPRPLILRGEADAPRAALAAELGGAVQREPVAARLVVFLRYSPGAELAVEPISQGEGLMLLLRNTPQVLADQPWILPPLERLIARAACCAGVRGDASSAAPAILKLAHHPLPSGERAG